MFMIYVIYYDVALHVIPSTIVDWRVDIILKGITIGILDFKKNCKLCPVIVFILSPG